MFFVPGSGNKKNIMKLLVKQKQDFFSSLSDACVGFSAPRGRDELCFSVCSGFF